MAKSTKRDYILNATGTVAETPQSQAIPGRPEMVQNEAGGFVWQIPGIEHVKRFLILGTEGNQYYATEQELTRAAAKVTEQAIRANGLETVLLIADISDRGLALKNGPALFALALALAYGTPETVAAAIAVSPRVARIQTHVNNLATYLDALGCLNNWRGRFAINNIIMGYSKDELQMLVLPEFMKTWLWETTKWEPGMQNSIELDTIQEVLETCHTKTGWDKGRTEEMLIKYRQRDGWTLGQLADLTHPIVTDGSSTDDDVAFDRAFALWYANWTDNRDKTVEKAKEKVKQASEGKALGDDDKTKLVAELSKVPLLSTIWVGKKSNGIENNIQRLMNLNDVYPRILAYEELRTETNKKRAIKLITDYRLPWECLPDQWASDKDVWTALLPHMPPEALVRSLGKLTANGTLETMSANTKLVRDKLNDPESLRRARLHPIRVLAAHLQYAAGHGARSKLTWSPIAMLVQATDDAFYSCFEYWEPTNKSRMFLVDVSGSMEGGQIGGVPGLSPNIFAGALAMLLARKEKDHLILGFYRQIREIGIYPTMRLHEAAQALVSNTFGDTDAAAGILHAEARGLKFDSFEIITDGQTWSGTIHPTQALARYRKATGDANVRMAMICTAAYAYSFADPKDALQRDFVGASTDTPKALEMFVRGDV